MEMSTRLRSCSRSTVDFIFKEVMFLPLLTFFSDSRITKDVVDEFYELFWMGKMYP